MHHHGRLDVDYVSRRTKDRFESDAQISKNSFLDERRHRTRLGVDLFRFVNHHWIVLRDESRFGCAERVSRRSSKVGEEMFALASFSENSPKKEKRRNNEVIFKNYEKFN